MTDFTKILDKAKELESKMKESQEKIKNIEVIGTSGSHSVKILMNGESEMIKINLSDEVMKEEKSIIEDLIVAAHNNAKSEIRLKTSEEISKSTSEFGPKPGSLAINLISSSISLIFCINLKRPFKARNTKLTCRF